MLCLTETMMAAIIETESIVIMKEIAVAVIENMTTDVCFEPFIGSHAQHRPSRYCTAK